jgi:galactokinase/mevalonate kinase-like predicted kinase
MTVQHLVSLPPAMAGAFGDLGPGHAPEWLAAHDPPGGKLGSGGGIAHLLEQAWKESSRGDSFSEWIDGPQKLLLMAGGQSRRLPAYAAPGKLLIPMPVLRWSIGQHLEQTLLDLQTPAYRDVLQAGAPHYRALVTSGDVLLRFGCDFAELPEADVLGFGMWVRPEFAVHFGVFFSPRENPQQWAFFRQKPSTEEIRELAEGHFYLVDTGMWLLSARAIDVLMRKCGWDSQRDCFRSGTAENFELYAGFGLSLGTNPYVFDPEISSLSCAVMPLPGAEFYHLGTSRQLIESVSALQNLQLDQTKLGGLATRPHPDQYILNSNFSYPRRQQTNHTLWVENSVIPATWSLEYDHVLTGVPENSWRLSLHAGQCLDFVPVGETGVCFRPYGIDDAFRGALGEESTIWQGAPVTQWLEKRNLTLQGAGLNPDTDLQQAQLFPVLDGPHLEETFLQWMLDEHPAADDQCRSVWLNSERLSAEEICSRFSPKRLSAQRTALLSAALPSMAENFRWNPFYRLDLLRTADFFAKHEVPLPAEPSEQNGDAMTLVHDSMFRAAVLRSRNSDIWAEYEKKAFHQLRDGVLASSHLPPVLPKRDILEDQIIWGRSPVRIDLAGGWTDTPPYCLEHGGRVVNVAVNLNGQPPIQVFARGTDIPEIVIRSIDLGRETRVSTYEDLDDFGRPESEFALAKAALALVGFLPRFHANGGAGSLRKQLESFGGGIEVSLLAAVPKGSGLGTSSILAATMLGVLSEFCGLGWDQATLSARTLALEQLLTTGGGWQDQVGGITRGIKLIETVPGFTQTPTLRYAPEHLLTASTSPGRALLYYTGITRMAKNILQEIVRGMFLNSATHLAILNRMRGHALDTYETLQGGDWTTFGEMINRTWQLNQALDEGTNPPQVAEVLARIQSWLAGAKLPGAGGGGYLLLLAKDEQAASHIRRELESAPPNPRARFVDFSISDLGLQITRS